MSRIDDLIAELCPDGVPSEQLGTIGRWYGGGTPSKSNREFWKGGTIPWVSPKDMGCSVLDSTQDHLTEAAVQGSATKVVPPTSVAMVVRSSILDRVFPVALVPVAVALNQDMKAVVPRKGVSPEFIAHVLKGQGLEILRAARKSGGSVASIETGKLFSFRIPIPPIEVQQAVVSELDRFAELEAKLETELRAELEARRKQYEHYRNSLLTFPEMGGVPMGELGTLFGGLTGKSKGDFSGGSARFVSYKNVFNNLATDTTAETFVRVGVDEKQRTLKRGDILFTGSSESRVEVGMSSVITAEVNEPIYLNSFCVGFRLFDSESLIPDFAKHLFRSSELRRQIIQTANGVTRFNVSKKRLAKVEVPVPPSSEQERIADVLDRFEALTNDLSISLPAELAARRKQYEYYRDKLLTFEELAA
jgi:type I restriction enzyme S subunit